MPSEQKPPIKKRRPGPLPRVDKAVVADALRKCGGIMSAAAKKLRVSRITVWKYVRRSPDLQEIIKEAQEELVDLSESQLLKLVKDRKHRGHTQAVLFVMKTLGRTRGFSERVELTGAPATDPTAEPIRLYLPQLDTES